MFRAGVLLLAATFIVIPVSRAENPETFSFTGSGYGHGVGMSQMGARALALAGESATGILNYYYKDVVVAPYVDSHTIRVNIGHLLRSVSFVTATPESAIQIYAGEVTGFTDIAPIAVLGTRQKASFRLDAAQNIVGPVTGKAFTIRWTGPNAVMTFSQPGSSAKYRYGQMQMKVVKGAIEVTNSLSLHDEYLWGISEISSAWPAAALEAQVIAARSYALSKISTIKPSCDCHVYSHIADQNFVGYSKEIEPKIGQLWKAAVNRTHIDTATSLAILAAGKPIQAYYSSSSGGATQTTLDAWGQATSYTQSVPDPAGLDPKLNPRFAQWKASATQELVKKAFLLPDVVTLEIVSRNSAGAVTYIKGTSSSGSTKLLRGDTFRSRVKIPSPYFQLALP
ncbi:stage II sporulation protein D [Candidatus Planktophila sulfonica]|uniref:Stage II sporulation protein D n=2 Tax=Candidatus Planktophila sulfonica TaxID=1884904 RepID=A0A249KHJ7_9ACTN|nr:stage II sporulation protein D [Candidatus Planktophila sulfonica]